MIIYLLKNTVNNKVYVGQTVMTLQKRWRTHLQKTVRVKGSYIGAAIHKYGPEVFERLVLKEGIETKKELDFWEQAFIAQLDSTNRSKGYNLTKGGGGCLGHRPTAEARRKLSEARRGNKNALGFKHTEETRRKVRQHLLGNKWSIGNKNAKGAVRSEAQKQMLREAAKARAGFKHTAETKAKIKDSLGSGVQHHSFNHDLSVDEMKRLYLSGKGCREVARIMDCSGTTVFRRLKEQGVIRTYISAMQTLKECRNATPVNN